MKQNSEGQNHHRAHQASNATTCQSQRQLHGHQLNWLPQDSCKEPDAVSGNPSSTGRHQGPRTVILRRGAASTIQWHKAKVELDCIWFCLVFFLYCTELYIKHLFLTCFCLATCLSLLIVRKRKAFQQILRMGPNYVSQHSLPQASEPKETIPMFSFAKQTLRSQDDEANKPLPALQ